LIPCFSGRRRGFVGIVVSSEGFAGRRRKGCNQPSLSSAPSAGGGWSGEIPWRARSYDAPAMRTVVRTFASPGPVIRPQPTAAGGCGRMGIPRSSAFNRLEILVLRQPVGDWGRCGRFVAIPTTTAATDPPRPSRGDYFPCLGGAGRLLGGGP